MHTPGPWESWPEGRNSGLFWIFSADKSKSALPLENGKADARLIAAAPDLLEMCKRLVAANVDTPGEVIREAQKVIAKATGEPQP